jgi:hypothetical protein
MKKKHHYRIRNWSKYNRGLTNRGSLTFWISQDLIDNWLAEELTGERGSSPTYTDEAMRAMASVKFVFHQAGRQTSGLVASIFQLMGVDLPVPDHSTVSRRMSGLEVELPLLPSKKARHIVIDSTGLKVYGEGEWKVRTHGVSKRRTWRKLHLAVDEQTNEIIISGASGNDVSDGGMFVEMIGQTGEEIDQVSLDGAYDQKKVYQAIEKKKIERAAIPPQKNAKIWKHGNTNGKKLLRDENLRHIRRTGRAKWKRESNYHRRSIAETAMFRYKTIFGDRLRSRKQANQFQEMHIKSAILNQMTHLGMPESYKARI